MTKLVTVSTAQDQIIAESSSCSLEAKNKFFQLATHEITIWSPKPHSNSFAKPQAAILYKKYY